MNKHTARALTLAAGATLASQALAIEFNNFRLINATTDTVIAEIADAGVINLGADGSAVNIQALLINGSPGSVKFTVTGAQNFTQVETLAPYALKGDVGGNYNVWTPAVGAYTLTAQAYSGPGATGTIVDQETFTFTVVNVANQAPVPNGDGLAVQRGRKVLFDLVANDTDPEGDALTIVSLKRKSSTTGTLELVNNQVLYTPLNANISFDTFEYTVTDGVNVRSGITVNYNGVNFPANLPPSQGFPLGSTTVGEPILIDVLAGATDPDNDALSIFRLTPNSTQGTVDILNNQVLYDPAGIVVSGPQVLDGFNYAITDGIYVLEPIFCSVFVYPYLTPAFTANSGGPTALGFAADNAFDNGFTYSTSNAIGGTADDALYQTERFGSAFSYNIPLANGSYTVVLKFAEIFHTTEGMRSFDVSLEGRKILSGFDLVAEAGAFEALDVVTNLDVTDGNLDIDFVALVDNAKVSAIQVSPKRSTGNAAPILQTDLFFNVVLGQPTQLDPLANDIDVDGPQALQILSVENVTNGTAQIVNNQVVFTLTSGTLGSFYYSVTDGLNLVFNGSAIVYGN